MPPIRTIAVVALGALALGACSSAPGPEDQGSTAPSAEPPAAGWVTDLDPAPFLGQVSAGHTTPAALNEAAGRTVGKGVWVAEISPRGLCTTDGTWSLSYSWSIDPALSVADGCVGPRRALFSVAVDPDRVEGPPEVLAGDPGAPEVQALGRMAGRLLALADD